MTDNISKQEPSGKKRIPPNAGKGRRKGSLNKTTSTLKEAILLAAEQAGNGSLVEYLAAQAVANPQSFMSLLGKVLPLQVNGEMKGDVVLQLISGVPRD